MIAPARQAAFTALAEVEAGHRTLPDAVAWLRRHLDDTRDVALATDIAIGAIRWRGTLDVLLAQLSSRPLDTLDAPLLRALRLSAYQLLHLDRVPASAIVHDGVALAKAHAGPGAGGFANALLRRLATPDRRPSLPPRPAADGRLAEWVTHLAATWSHPAWLVTRWVRALGPDAAEARLRYAQSHAPITLRASRRGGGREALRARLAELGVETAPARFAPEALEVTHGNPLRGPAAAAGGFLVQDEGSQLVALYADARAGARVLDVCAAPGGKTVAMAEDAGPAGLVVAGDLRRRRVRLLRQTVRAAAVPTVRVVAHDGAVGLPYRDAFDLVLVDAPCSGLGTLRRDPDVKWAREEAGLAGFAARQRRLLAEAARVVAPGGRLVYATCSTEPEENEDVVSWFAAAHPAFRRAGPPPSWRQGPLAELLAADGALQTTPERHGLDAFYAAAFERPGGVRA